ncbi:hypothetical protein GGR25_000238 [Kaistia hirudinis]|uniref:Uncharacterized protein n=1 Tax=Kaistia hirudinis TaxID=1293440 RepID=A0A840AFT1_9HYPH|nr:hypothetical protein [Kaistia hirudinis]MBB3929219.1 hypothetical protein [Kaistia hirudinis]
MALTLEAEQRMTDVGVVAFYAGDAESWLATVRATKKFVKRNFPPQAFIRRDDVAKALIPILEVHEAFRDFRNAEKLRGKFWIKDFADLLIDRTWDNLDAENENGENGTES